MHDSHMAFPLSYLFHNYTWGKLDILHQGRLSILRRQLQSTGFNFMLVSWTKACLISLLDVWAEQSMFPAFQIRLARRLTQKN